MKITDDVRITDERTSSYSGNANSCAAVGHAECRAAGRKPRASNYNGGCANVSVAGPAGRRMISVSNDNTDPAEVPQNLRGPVLFTPKEWRAFIAGVRNGEFDLDGDDLLPPVATTTERV